MSKNNPFRNKPSTSVECNVEDWGKSKFMPKISKGLNKKHLNSNMTPFSKNYDDRKSIFHKNKEKFRFNEVAKDAKAENSTPWSKYKDEIIFKQRDESQAARQANMESDEAKIILKQREINYRKCRVEQKKNETTKWEDFAEDSEQNDTETQHVKFSSKQKGNQSNKFQRKAESSNTFFKTKFKKNIPKSNLKKPDFISKDLLDNFDSKELSFNQNDKLRRVITKTTNMASGNSLKSVVNDMKRKKKQKLVK